MHARSTYNTIYIQYILIYSYVHGYVHLLLVVAVVAVACIAGVTVAPRPCDFVVAAVAGVGVVSPLSSCSPPRPPSDTSPRNSTTNRRTAAGHMATVRPPTNVDRHPTVL
ncbi:hypothetical protein NP493_749g00006 [Ridgeia piscesae]|uniref:Uncharacterized protein n=1 Tax=Ridgeia piscesae TaxID=27915 RepID=A0AAD9KR31_RIDPI|nr:hypothetical protein NP493_749g00006 [Ridgeia piscesae]